MRRFVTFAILWVFVTVAGFGAFAAGAKTVPAGKGTTVAATKAGATTKKSAKKPAKKPAAKKKAPAKKPAPLPK